MPQAYIYTSPSTNITYVLNTTFTTFKGAEATCNEYGGHLISYKSIQENQEVEVGTCQLPALHAHSSRASSTCLAPLGLK